VRVTILPARPPTSLTHRTLNFRAKEPCISIKRNLCVGQKSPILLWKEVTFCLPYHLHMTHSTRHLHINPTITNSMSHQISRTQWVIYTNHWVIYIQPVAGQISQQSALHLLHTVYLAACWVLRNLRLEMVDRMQIGVGRRNGIGCLELQVSFRKRATSYRAILRENTYKNKVSNASAPPYSSRQTLLSIRDSKWSIKCKSEFWMIITGLFSNGSF